METALDTYNAFRARSTAANAAEFSEKHRAWVEYCAEIDKLRGLI
jgi:hypothetical protein